ncbi:MAG TPA: hypothetical protein VGQ76_21575 [Thermoanaerobaculia bacterium]|jgi:hypothetical protein|nr:hypothetical protein [Thermoanaerobaculia bacterium]
MRFKKSRFGPRLVAAARSGQHYRDVHVFIGGTGAVGGAAALQMVAMLEEMMTIRPPDSPADVPILIVTGRSDDEVHSFESRLKRFTRTRWGAGTTPRHFEHGFLSPGGVYIAVSKFELKPIPGLEIVTDADIHSRASAVDEFLKIAGVDRKASHEEIGDALMRHVRSAKPITSYLEDRLVRLRDYGPKPFRSVLLGFPLPSILAYQTGGLAVVAKELGLGGDFISSVKDAFENTFSDDLVSVDKDWGARVLVAHTTGVGGMYDESPDGTTTLRLGFAHAARDEFLRSKHHEAEHLTTKYAQRGILMLVTAAAIGIDEVRMREKIPLHGGIVKALRDAPHELFRGSRERRQFIQVFKPTTLRLTETAKPKALHFKRGEELLPEYAIRSGENGFFSVANADALYRVMKVASVSELGHVLATVGLLGDDPNVPWFADGICYYTETANETQVFDFLAQPVLLGAQLSGIDPMALQDLGSAKHQAELHTLSLLILLHRLRTLDIEAIEEYPDLSFNARKFFLENSEPLTFRDVDQWDVDTLARDLHTLVTADRPGQLLPLKPLIDPGQFGTRDQAHLDVLKLVLDAVFTITSLGSPIIVEDANGNAIARTGYWVAPLGDIVTDDDSLRRVFADSFAKAQPACTLDQYQSFQMAVNGFIDLRPLAIVASAKLPSDLNDSAVTLHRDVASFAQRLSSLEPYSFFATCGLVAVMHRLRALGRMLSQARTDLGTMQDWVWTMRRDARGHTYVVPGVVEALRMIAEGQEKTTGTEWLDGIWGYERRLPAMRVEPIVEEVTGRHS